MVLGAPEICVSAIVSSFCAECILPRCLRTSLVPVQPHRSLYLFPLPCGCANELLPSEQDSGLPASVCQGTACVRPLVLDEHKVACSTYSCKVRKKWSLEISVCAGRKIRWIFWVRRLLGAYFGNSVDIIQCNSAKNSKSTLKISHLKAAWRQQVFHSVKCWEGYFQMEMSVPIFFSSHLVFQEALLSPKYGLLNAALHFPVAKEHIHLHFMLKNPIPLNCPGVSIPLQNLTLLPQLRSCSL